MEKPLCPPSQSDPASPETAGMDARRLERAVTLFQRQQRSGAFPGGQLSVIRHGMLVLNEVVGIARGFRPDEPKPPIQVKPNTPFPVLSAGKPLAAIAIAMLEGRGQLDMSAPIADIFPEFGQGGKEKITILDVLTHRSGMLMPGFVQSKHLWGDRAAVQKALIEAVPVYPRGTLAYHPHEYGWILNEIVLRVDGRSLPEFFAEEIAIPLELPALRFGLAGRDIHSMAYSYWLGKKHVIIAGTDVAEDFEWQNSEAFCGAMNPATSLVCDAASLAGFYDFLIRGGKTASGQELISKHILRQYSTRQVLGWDRSLRVPLALGRGFIVGTQLPSSYGWWGTQECFGHGGGFSSLAFGDYRTGIAAAIVTNGNRSNADLTRRFMPLAHGLRMACRD